MTERTAVAPHVGLRATEAAKTTPDTFAAVLRALREWRRLSQSEVGRRAALGYSYISRLESGDRRPTRDTVHALADALDATPAERDALLDAAGFAVTLSSDVRRFAALPVEVRRVLLDIAAMMGRDAA